MGDETDDTKSSERPAMDAPQEEFIEEKAVPSQPEKFGGSGEQQEKTKTNDDDDEQR